MIQFSEVLADAYVSPSRNIAMPSMPGRQVKFLQGHAAIKDGRDLAAMLRRADVKLVLTEYSLSWIEEIEKAAGEVRADVRRPTQLRQPDGAPAAGFQIPPERKPSPFWDADWPRDPKTGRMLKRNAVAADSAEPGS